MNKFMIIVTVFLLIGVVILIGYFSFSKTVYKNKIITASSQKLDEPKLIDRNEYTSHEEIPMPGKIVDLKVTILKQTSDEITLKYTFKNLSTNHEIFVFDQLLSFGEKGDLTFDDTGAYVFQKDSVARIVRGIVNPPIFLTVSKRVPIVASLLEPKGEKTGEIKLHVPLSEVNQYFPLQKCTTSSLQDISKLLVQFGWVTKQDGVITSNLKVGDKDFIKLSGTWTPMENLVETEISVQGISLCPYVGKFDRPTLEDF